MKSRVLSAAIIASASALLTSPAVAHHAMDNALPVNAFQGLVSGVAHPVIGVDHLLFVLAVGAACYLFGRAAATIATFIIATLAGTAIHLNGATLAYPDAWVAATLIVLGAAFFAARGLLKSSGALAFFASSGILHGYAYGEAIVGAEPAPLLAYLVGFAAVQLSIALGSFALVRHVHRAQHSQGVARAIGAALTASGATFLALLFV